MVLYMKNAYNKRQYAKAIYEILGEEADKLELVLEMVVLHLVQHSLQLWNLLNANLKRKNNEAVIIVKFKTKIVNDTKTSAIHKYFTIICP